MSDGFVADDFGSKVFASWRSQSAPAWRAFTHHAFVHGLGDGSLPRAAFLHYLVQDYVFLIHFARAWALAVLKAQSREEMRSAASVVDGLVNHEMQLHVKVCSREGLTEDALFHAALSQGAEGGVLASAHIDTARCAAIRDMHMAGDQPGALRAWRALVDLPRLLFAEPSPAPIKHWLWRAGLIDSPEVRLPMLPVSDTLAARIAREMEQRARPAGVSRHERSDRRLSAP